MKILLASITLDNPELETGVTTYTRVLVKTLLRTMPGCEISILLSPLNSRRFTEFRNIDITIIPNSIFGTKYRVLRYITILRSLFSVLFNAIGIVSVGRLLNPLKISFNPDFVIYTTFGIAPMIPVLIKSSLPKARLISSIHDLRFFHNKIPRGFYFYALQIRILNFYSDLILVPSKEVETIWLRELNCSNEKVRISFSPSEFCDSIPSTINYGRLPEKYLFFPSTIVDSKNHKTLVEALASVVRGGVDISLLLCGSIGDEKLWVEVKELILQYEIGERWAHLGFVSDGLKGALYKRAVALIIPSVDDSFSLPIWEAFYFGCPVLCSNTVDLIEQTAGAALYFDPLDAEDISRKIRLIVDDSAIRESLCQKGHERLRNAFGDGYGESWKGFLSCG